MKNYYYSEGNTKLGPLSLDELKSLKIDSSTLIWCEGMKDWTKAIDVPEMESFFKTAVPPPLPFSSAETNFSAKLDSRNKNEAKSNLIRNGIIGLLGLLLGIAGIMLYQNRKQNTPPPVIKDTKLVDTVVVKPATVDNKKQKNSNANVINFDNDETENESEEPDEIDVDLLKKDLKIIEESEPLKYLSVSYSVDGTLSGRARIKGKIRNSATLAKYKDAVLKMTFYTKTSTAIGQQNKTLYEDFNPRSSKNFDWKIAVPGKTKSVKVELYKASVY